MPPQFVFQMNNVSKFYGDKPILQNFNLSLPRCQIGIVGENGAANRRCCGSAGLDQEILGTAQITKGMRVLMVPQEPASIRKRMCVAISREPLPIQQLIERYDAVMERMGEDLSEEMEKVNDEFDFLQNEIDRLDGWNIDACSISPPTPSSCHRMTPV